MALTPEEISRAMSQGIHVTRLTPHDQFGLYGAPRYTSYAERTAPGTGVPQNILDYRRNFRMRGAHLSKADDLKIWRHMSPYSHWNTDPQATLDAFRQARRAIRQGSAAYLDTEILGKPGANFFAMTEVAIKHGQSPRHWLIRPDDASARTLSGLIRDLELRPDKVSMADHEWRALRDIMRYADIDSGKVQALRDVSNIMPGSSLAGHTKTIQAGLDKLMQHGLDPTQASQQINDYMQTLTTNRAMFITYSGAHSDFPWLNTFMQMHGNAPLNTSRHLDAYQAITAMGLHGDTDIGTSVRQKSMEATVKRWGIRPADYVQPHTAYADIELLQDLVESPEGLIPRGKARLREMIARTRRMYRQSAGSTALNPIGTGHGYDPRPMKVGDELFTVAGMKSDFQAERGIYDMMWEKRGDRWRPIDWSDNALYRNVKYQLKSFQRETIGGEQFYSAFLDAEDLNVRSKITAQTPEELQNILHKRTIPWKMAQRLGYETNLSEILTRSGRTQELQAWSGVHMMGTSIEDTFRTTTRRELDSAQRTYRRMLDFAGGDHRGHRLAQRLYGAAESGEMRGLSPTERRAVEIMGPRLRQEAGYARGIIQHLRGRKEMSDFERDLAFGRSMRMLGDHHLEMPILPWERQIEVASDFGTLRQPRAAAGYAVGRGRYTTVNLADPDGATSTLMSILSPSGTKGTLAEERVRSASMRRILHDLQGRGIIDSAQLENVLGVRGGEVTSRTAARQADILIRMLRELNPDHDGLIGAVEFEHFAPRMNIQATSTPEQVSRIANQVAEEVMFKRNRLTNTVFQRQMKKTVNIADDAMTTFFDPARGIGAMTPSGTATGYSSGMSSIIKAIEGEGLKTAAVPMLDPHTGQIRHMSLHVYPERLSRAATRAAYLSPGEIIPGVMQVDLPVMTPQGRIEYGGLSRIPVPALHTHDPDRIVTPMEQIAREVFSDAKVKRMAQRVAEGDYVGAQGAMRRDITRMIQRWPGLGKSYKDAGQIDTARWSQSHPVVADVMKQHVVSADAYIQQQLNKEFPTSTDRYRNLVEHYTSLTRPGTGYFMAGKEDEVAKGLLSKIDIHGLHPFGALMDPKRAALAQYFGHYRLAGDLEEQIIARGLSDVVTSRQILSTEALENVIRQAGGDYTMGLNVKAALMTDLDIKQSIDKVIQDPSTPRGVAEELQRMKYISSTREGMALISEDVLPLFKAQYEKTIQLDHRQLQDFISTRAGAGRKLLPFEEIIPGVRWQDLGAGEILGLEENVSGAKLRIMSTLDAPDSVKLMGMASEKMTTVPLSRAAIRAITGVEDASLIFMPEIEKHMVPGAWMEGQLKKGIFAAQRQGVPIPESLKTPLLQEMERVMLVSQDVVKGLDKKKAQEILDILETIPGYQLHEGRDNVLTSMIQLVRTRVGDPLYYADAHGRMTVDGGRVITGRGAKIGFREILSLKGRGEGLDPLVNYFEQAIRAGGTFEVHERALQGTFRAARALFDPSLLEGITDTRHVSQLQSLGRPLEGGKYLDLIGTALQPEGLRPGDVYNLQLPETITRKQIEGIASDLGKKSHFKDTLAMLKQHLPEQMDVIPIGVQHYPGTYVGELGRAQHQLMESVSGMHSAIGDAEKYAKTYNIHSDQSRHHARTNFVTRLAEYYDQMNKEIASSGGEAFNRLMHGRLPSSGRLTLQGIAPLRLQEMGLPEHTAIVSKDWMRNILGEDYSRYFQEATDEFGLARMVGAEQGAPRRLMGVGVRYPNVGPQSVAPLHYRVADWARPNVLYGTPGVVKGWHGDFDDDKVSVFIMNAAKKLREPAEQARVALSNWMERHGAKTAFAMDEPGLTKAASEIYGDILTKSGMDLFADAEIREAMNIHATRVKAAKTLIGPTSVSAAMLRDVAAPVYGLGTDEYKRIAEFATAMEEGSIQVKHGILATEGGPAQALREGKRTELIQALRETEPPALKFKQLMTDIMKRKAAPSDIFELEQMGIKGVSHENLAQVEDLLATRFGPTTPHHRIQAMYQHAEHMDRHALVHMAKGVAPDQTDRIMHTYTTTELLKKLGAAGKTRAEEIRVGDLVMQSLMGPDDVVLERTTQAHKAHSVMGDMLDRLGKMKATPTTALWAVGIAAGLYAFQAARGKATMMDRPRRPQPDQAPEVDGEYAGAMPPEMQKQSSPIARIYQQGEGYDGLQVRVRATSPRNVDNEYLAQAMRDAMQAQIPVPLDLSVRTSDNRSRMSRQEVERIISSTIKGTMV